jgi:hypothetical protein
MRVFTPHSDHRFRSLCPISAGDDLMLMTYPPERRSEHWSPPEIQVVDEHNEVGDFAMLSSNIIIIHNRAKDILQPILEKAGELLPLPCKGQTFWLLNLLQYWDCVDVERTQWTGPHENIRKGGPWPPYSFDRVESASGPQWEMTGSMPSIPQWPVVYLPERFGEGSLFKPPECPVMPVRVLERTGDPTTEFKAAVEHHGLKGIRFKLEWEG